MFACSYSLTCPQVADPAAVPGLSKWIEANLPLLRGVVCGPISDMGILDGGGPPASPAISAYAPIAIKISWKRATTGLSLNPIAGGRVAV